MENARYELAEPCVRHKERDNPEQGHGNNSSYGLHTFEDEERAEEDIVCVHRVYRVESQVKRLCVACVVCKNAYSADDQDAIVDPPELVVGL